MHALSDTLEVVNTRDATKISTRQAGVQNGLSWSLKTTNQV